MKNKKNRKCFRQPSPQLHNLTLRNPEILKFKFIISNDNISCFMNKSKVSKRPCRKTSHSSMRSQKPSSKAKTSVPKKAVNLLQNAQVRKKQVSPDIVRESSNTILSKIQQKGILCAWNQVEQQVYSRDQMQESSDQDINWSAFGNSAQKSFASTNDYPHYHTVNLSWNILRQPCEVYINSITNSFVVQPEFIQNDWRTTLMVRNIPNKYTINQLADEIDSQHANTYDFLYLPCDPKNNCNVGYGFINFVSTDYLLTFYYKFNQYVWQKYKSQKICALTYARLQGLNQLIEHFENSKVLNQKEKKYRPIIKLDKIHKMVMEQQGR